MNDGGRFPIAHEVLHPAHEVLHPAHEVLHPTHEVLHPAHEVLHPAHEVLLKWFKFIIPHSGIPAHPCIALLYLQYAIELR